PDLVLLDIKLPVMSGYDIAGMLTNNRTFRRNGRPVPIVMLSGKDGIFDRFRAKRAGAEDFIAKPFEKRDLIRKVFPLLDLDLSDELAATEHCTYLWTLANIGNMEAEQGAMNTPHSDE